MPGLQRIARLTPARKLAAVGLALALAVVPVLATAGGAVTTAPPFEPLPNPPAVGTLKFFNAAGTQITSGSVNDAPFAAYIQSSVAGRSGDTKATLYGYLPKSGVPYDAWSGLQLTASPSYPIASAPGPLGSSALPLVSVTSGDSTLSSLAGTFPNTATDAYQGL